MKDILKNKILWIGVGCIVISIISAIVSSVASPSDDLILKMQKAINKRDVEAYAACFAPEDREAATYSFGLLFLEDNLNTLLGGENANSASETKIYILQGNEIENTDGTINIPVTWVYINDSGITNTSDDTITIYELEGTKYIEY